MAGVEDHEAAEGAAQFPAPDTSASPVGVLLLSVKPLRPTVTGARLLFDAVVAYFREGVAGPEQNMGCGSFAPRVAVAGPLTRAETRQTAAIGPEVFVASAHTVGGGAFLPSGVVARGVAACRWGVDLALARRPARLRSGWVHSAARHFRSVANDAGAAVTIACGQDSATVARLAGVHVDVLLLPSLEFDATAASGVGGGLRGRARTLMGWLDRRARHACEARALSHAARVVVSTEADRSRLIDEYGIDPQRVVRIPHGIAVRVPPETSPLPVESESPSVLIVGSLSYPPNANAAELACDSVRRARATVPDLMLRVVGNAAGAPARLTDEPAATLVGTVDDLDAEYRRAIGVVAPFTAGGGGRIKVLEALAHGLPVVTTARGIAGLVAAGPFAAGAPIPGVWLVDEGPSLVADTAAVLAQWCADRSGLAASGVTGRRWVAEAFGHDVIGERWRSLVCSLLLSEVSGTGSAVNHASRSGSVRGPNCPQ